MKPLERPSWEEYALILAHTAALRCEDPWWQTGACAMRRDRSIAAVGYNGAPSGTNIDWSDRDKRRPRTIHAEQNCLRYCKPGELWLMATTISPCSHCLMELIAYGVRAVVFSEPYDKDTQAFDLAKEFSVEFKQCNISRWLITRPRCTMPSGGRACLPK